MSKKRSETRYYSDNYATVVAKLSNVKNISDELEDTFGFWKACNIKSLLKYKGVEDSRNSFVGKAFCDERDEYDEAVGRKIASLKADRKYHKHMMKQYDVFIRSAYNLYIRLLNNYIKHYTCYNKLENKLNEFNEWRS